MKSWIPDARNFAYLTWKQVDALPRDTTVLVLPTAAIEQHVPISIDPCCNYVDPMLLSDNRYGEYARNTESRYDELQHFTAMLSLQMGQQHGLWIVR